MEYPLNRFVPNVEQPTDTQPDSTDEATTVTTSRDIDVIIAAHDIARWETLRAAVGSVHAQTQPPGSIVVVIDHAPELLERAQRELAATVVANDGQRGASGARNAGARASRGRALAFLDDDAVADPDWIAALARHLGTSRALGISGRVLPMWDGNAPAWFPAEFLWLVGASYRGQPSEVVHVRNAWSNNMCVRRHAFDAVGGFREGFGKVGRVSSPEDTDFCLRVNELAGEATWLNAPDAVVHHVVPPKRTTFRFFVWRSFNEGRGKAVLQDLLGHAATSSEVDYARTTLPAGMLEGVREAFRGDGTGLARAGAIFVGLGATACGYLYEGVRTRIRAPSDRLRTEG